MQRYGLFAMFVDFRLVIKCKCFVLFVCLFGWCGLVQQNMKDLGSIDRRKKSENHWAMESKEVGNILTGRYGISKGKSNLARGSFSLMDEMEINDLE